MDILRVLGRLFSKKQEPNNADPLSIVLLLREFNEFPESILVPAAERAWAADFHSEDSGNYVVRNEAVGLIKFGDELFLNLLSVPRPYGGAAAREVERMPDLRRRTAWAEHRAWFSIDDSDPASLSKDGENHKIVLMGRLAAELLNKNCTGVYLPRSNYLMPCDDALRERLRTFESRENLYSTEPLPVLVVDEEDPKLAEVVAQARAAWSQFLVAFQHRQPEDTFLVKAPFTEGENGEWMWIEVASIHSGRVIGPLHSDPASLRNVVQGDQVEAREADIGDWYYVQNGTEHGGFSRALLE
jgi:uncharacterized protein YegJ (DUF2314 family)